jgi:hypothetical protein
MLTIVAHVHHIVVVWYSQWHPIMTKGNNVTNNGEYIHMKLTHILGSAIHLRNVRRCEILNEKDPGAVGTKADRDTGEFKLKIVFTDR